MYRLFGGYNFIYLRIHCGRSLLPKFESQFLTPRRHFLLRPMRLNRAINNLIQLRRITEIGQGQRLTRTKRNRRTNLLISRSRTI